MAETLESSVRDVLRNYVREVKSLPNESAKRSRFASLIAELFPGSNAVNEYARGVEKLIRISSASGVKLSKTSLSRLPEWKSPTGKRRMKSGL
jgi:hypothetical protein